MHESIHDALVERFVDAAKGLVVGDPLEDGTDQGALVSQSQLDKVSRYVDLAWFIKGLFFRPKSFVLARDANTCAAKFLQTYQRESGVELRGEILQDVGHRCRRVAMTYRSRKRFRSLLHLAPNRAMGRFLDAKEWVHVGE